MGRLRLRNTEAGRPTVRLAVRLRISLVSGETLHLPDGDSHKIFQPTAGAGDDVQEKHVERNVYVASGAPADAVVVQTRLR
jgi:hypothetical protein